MERAPRLHVAYRAVLLAAGLVVAGLAFRHLVTLLLAMVMTVIISIPLSATASRLERRGVPRPLGALAGLLAGLAVVGGMLALVIPPFVDQVDELVESTPEIVESLRSRIHETTGASSNEIGDRVQSFLRRYTDDPMRLIGPIAAIGAGVAGVLAALVVMTMTAYYIAVRPEPLIEGMVRLFPPDRRQRAVEVLERVRESWIGWLRGVAIDMAVTGGLLYAGLRIVGLEYAVVFAVVTALLVVVPYYGSIVGAIPPVLFALTDSPGMALLVLAVYVAVQQVEGNLVLPLVMSRTVRLHPATIAVGVVMVGALFGVVGLFVAVPLIATAAILVEELWIRRVEEPTAGYASDMPGPQPEEPDAPERAERHPGQPETAPDGEPATGFPEPPGRDPGDRSGDESPHHALNTPVGEPDPTEWPDPYDKRDDPLDPPDPDGQPFGEEPHPQTGATSTSQPHPSRDPEAPDWEGPERDNLDE